MPLIPHLPSRLLFVLKNGQSRTLTKEGFLSSGLNYGRARSLPRATRVLTASPYGSLYLGANSPSLPFFQKPINMNTRFVILLAILALSYAQQSQQLVYLIRHGEKPENGTGLSPAGVARSQCLPNVFGTKSLYNIGYIMAQEYKKDGGRDRPFLTVSPLAKSLGLKVDVSCNRDDAACVKKAVAAYQKTQKGSKHPKNILICWEHGALTQVASALGVSPAPKYPGSHFDLIWTLNGGKNFNTTSEKCPGDKPLGN
ncbi:phosphoglycerate mutase family protein [Planoprotostelium fungivorum]|uniref:Phosphoglycerate mutase family protein n=1 Tax=Planoprotostelium fungivorum TaxID=1890364 RepID=A0A2P6MWH5_9EUKA|nr:phosphoglycerate mutase family protein [Planoprotostelium fungivorum]